MKKIFLPVFLVFFSTICFSQSILGIWKTLDDDGKTEAHIEVYKGNDGKIYGKIVKLIGFDNPESLICYACKDERKRKPIIGMTILTGMSEKSKSGYTYSGGEVMDPENGIVASALIALEGVNKLKVRGYLKFVSFGKTEYWYRLKQS